MWWYVLILMLVGWQLPDIQEAMRRSPRRWGTTFEEEP